ncbi:MAG: DUF4910 domain-containing protein [Candidatus Aminicenantes bacterium]|nr:DUF4910 domain-containing protein [Candidatus Aminicenantes bacterium]
MKIRNQGFFLISFLIFVHVLMGQDTKPSSKPLRPPSARTGLLLTDETTLKLIHHSSGDLAHDYVSQISLWDRSQVTPGYRESAEWILKKANEFGLKEVQIESFPSGSSVRYFENATRSRWAVTKAELWLLSPFPLKITSYAELPMSLAGNSVSSDVETELVDIGSGTSEADYRQDVKGKIVLTSNHPEMIMEKAVYEKGAAGIISYWSVPSVIDLPNRQPGDFPDHVGWARLPEPTNEKPGSFAFMISARRAQELKLMLETAEADKPSGFEFPSMASPPPGIRSRGPVRVKAAVETQSGPGTLDVVSGIIPGSKYPEEEIVITAHLCHYKPGAVDNASGSASILEMARTLLDLIQRGELPPPLRTIRFLWVPEYTGTWAWLDKHLKDSVVRIANLNFDMPGPDLTKTNAVFSISYTADYVPSYLNAMMESILDFMNANNDQRYAANKEFQIISVRGSRTRLQGRMLPFEFGTDYEVFNNLGIPGTNVIGWPDNNYHTDADSPDKVDPTQLHRTVFAGLAAGVMIAYADQGNAADIAHLTLVYGKERIHRSEEEAAQMVLCSTADDFLESKKWAKNLIRHAYEREREAIISSNVFARRASEQAVIQQTARLLEDDQEDSLRYIGELAAAKSKSLGIQDGEIPPSDAEKRAARFIPARNAGKELLGIAYVASAIAQDKTLDLPSLMEALDQASVNMREKGTDDLRIFSLFEAPGYYADGKRSLLDIRNAIAAEYIPLPIEALELYFRAFEKAGVMSLTEK